jgi:F-type H+-transporting ATPase subunit delta
MSFDDRQTAVARVYADALLGLAERRGEADELRDELAAVAAEVERDDALRAFLVTPLVDAEARAASLERIFRGRASDLLVDGLQVLNRKGRLGLVPAIAAVYARAHNQLRGRIEVAVTSAVPLDDEQRAAVAAAVARRSGRRALLQETVDPALVGGMVIQIGDQKADASVASRLHALSDALLDRASREIQAGGQIDT